MKLITAVSLLCLIGCSSPKEEAEELPIGPNITVSKSAIIGGWEGSCELGISNPWEKWVWTFSQNTLNIVLKYYSDSNCVVFVEEKYSSDYNYEFGNRVLSDDGFNITRLIASEVNGTGMIYNDYDINIGIIDNCLYFALHRTDGSKPITIDYSTCFTRNET